ncbi:hypothetical protein Pcinc_008673 [Petrolisthes cinctipes]|uniref:DNA 5'-3' helicase n=1 Tax=Petrolisthes cinctipes TaxID=88211 RepID=A0AAE1G8T2_PETCI|nr:hypothetical protein Pcinc_008673 [Petrolisthes cinctipes]
MNGVDAAVDIMNELHPPEEFTFPFPPYDIQRDFMRALFDVLEKGQLGIFESPTGTGKSLSLICGALTWLQHHNTHYKAELTRMVEETDATNAKDDSGPDWFTAATKRREGEERAREWRKELRRLQQEEVRVTHLKERRKHIKRPAVQKIDEEFDELFRDLHEVQESVRRELSTSANGEEALGADEAAFLLDDYHSDDESENGRGENQEDEEENPGCLKIFFCSRTHSQLSQFVREVQRSSFSADVRTVSLASRQNLCVNPDVTRLSHVSLINDRCVELQRGKKGRSTKVESDGVTSKKKKSSSGCPFQRQNTVQALADQFLLEVQDIEQMVTAGRKAKSCPYYAGRYAIRDAQLVVVPYNTLLHKGTREASGIKLKGNIVIVDEAHNLLETLSGIHSVLLSLRQVRGARAQLSHYREKYSKRLCPRNLLYINQIIFFMSAIIKMLEAGANNKPTTAPEVSSQVFDVGKFLVETFTDNLNLFKLLQYIEESKLAHKLHSFSQHFEGSVTIHRRQRPQPPSSQASSSSSSSSQVTSPSSSTSSFLARMTAQKKPPGKAKENVKPESQNEIITANNSGTKEEDGPHDEEEEEVVSGSPLLQVKEFLGALVHGTGKEGRIVVTPGRNLKYLLLNPASHFSQVVAECRSVIVAGGTMRPVSEFQDQLFQGGGGRVVHFSCGHVVDASTQLLPLAVARGPSGLTLDFTYQRRGDPNMLEEIGRVLVNVVRVVPGGVVIFLPSYQYEKRVVAHLQASGAWTKIAEKKEIFREPKKSSELDGVLSSYSRVIRNSHTATTGVTGALLLCVVGGKMSEGINFSDELGRCVVMIGLPFPNTHSPELKEKMDYLNKYVATGPDGRQAGSVFYKNLCFKAVNQSIGRAIRHRQDHASILLLDHRYTLDSSISALPDWISQYLHKPQTFSQVFGQLVKFFKGQKERST